MKNSTTHRLHQKLDPTALAEEQLILFKVARLLTYRFYFIPLVRLGVKS
jgi:hypothetical protein